MTSPISEKRRRLLVQLESIIGNEFYNGNIQNYGPGGVREAQGRGLRYPVVFRNSDGTKEKFKEHTIPKAVASDILLSGHYVLGANQLDVMNALNEILLFLEKHEGLSIDQPER